MDKLGANLLGMYLAHRFSEWQKTEKITLTDDHWGHGVKHGNRM
jgi:hypothetical protein